MSLNNQIIRDAPYEFGTSGYFKTNADTTTDLGEESCIYGPSKKPNDSKLSNNYLMENSWTNFSGQQFVVDDIQVPTIDSNKSPSGNSDAQLAAEPLRVTNPICAFTNDPIACTQQEKYESMVAWHEANCGPSTSKGNFQADIRMPATAKRKRCNTNNRQMQPSGMTSANRSTNITLHSNESINSPTLLSGCGELSMPDISTNTSSDNPLQRMEKMTQGSHFEPPAKLSRISSEASQPARSNMYLRELERNAKLEKMRTLEQQLIFDKARSDWDRMVHEHEVIKMTRGYMPPVMQDPQFGMQNGSHVQTQFGNVTFMQQQNGIVRPMSNCMSSVAMSMSQPTAQPACDFQPQQASNAYSFCTYNSPVNASSSINSGYPQGVTTSNVPQYYQSSFMPSGIQMQVPQRYGVYPQDYHNMYVPEKSSCIGLDERMSQSYYGLCNQAPSQNVQYYPNNAIVNGNYAGPKVDVNPIFMR